MIALLYILLIDKNLQTTIEKQVRLYINDRKKYGINNASIILIDFTTMEVLASIDSGEFFNNDICGQIITALKVEDLQAQL
ncbi:MAG: hypothetical protein IRF12RH_04175 [Rickettsia helvetica]|uniref:Uncharacterized protein n=1 Tax=Rickettsia helvetica TaxID=35789 RepID=A0ABM9NBQ3_RICHE